MINTGRSIRLPSGNGGGSNTSESGSSPLENNEIKKVMSSNVLSAVHNIVFMTPLRWCARSHWSILGPYCTTLQTNVLVHLNHFEFLLVLSWSAWLWLE